VGVVFFPSESGPGEKALENALAAQKLDLLTWRVVPTREEILGLRDVCHHVLVAPHVQDHAIDLVMATQPNDPQSHELAKKFVRYGSSPRGAQAVTLAGFLVTVTWSAPGASVICDAQAVRPMQWADTTSFHDSFIMLPPGST